MQALLTGSQQTPPKPEHASCPYHADYSTTDVHVTGGCPDHLTDGFVGSVDLPHQGSDRAAPQLEHAPPSQVRGLARVYEDEPEQELLRRSQSQPAPAWRVLGGQDVGNTPASSAKQPEESVRDQTCSLTSTQGSSMTTPSPSAPVASAWGCSGEHPDWEH